MPIDIKGLKELIEIDKKTKAGLWDRSIISQVGFQEYNLLLDISKMEEGMLDREEEFYNK